MEKLSTDFERIPAQFFQGLQLYFMKKKTLQISAIILNWALF